jgi:hypothetical protein
MDIEKKINTLIAECRVEKSKPGSYPYLPEIIESLHRMNEVISVGSEHPRYAKIGRDRMAGALGRIVMENISFSESVLGGKLLDIAEKFASGK